MKRKLLLFLVLAMLFLSACGSGASQFKVSYLWGATPNLSSAMIHGELDGEELNLDLNQAFKDCQVKDVKTAGKEGTLSISGTKDGHLEFIDGIIVTLEDADDKTIDVTIKKDSVFAAEKEGDTVHLLVPEDKK